MKAKLFMNPGMLVCCAACIGLILISDAGYAYAARFSRQGVASSGSFAPRQAVKQAPVADSNAPGYGYTADRVESSGAYNQPPAPEPPPENLPSRADAIRDSDRPGRGCPPGVEGRACRKYYHYDDDVDYVDDDYEYTETVEELPCATSGFTVGQITYYRCNSGFYTQIFSNDKVLYVKCEPPAGY